MAKSEEVTEKNHDIKLIVKNKNPKRGFARFKERIQKKTRNYGQKLRLVLRRKEWGKLVDFNTYVLDTDHLIDYKAEYQFTIGFYILKWV